MPVLAIPPQAVPCANHVRLVGVVTSEIHVRRSKSSHYVAFTLTTHEYRTTRRGTVEVRQNHRCALHDDDLDHFEASVHHGTVLEVEGRLVNDDTRVRSIVEVESFRVVQGPAVNDNGFPRPIATVHLPDGPVVLAGEDGEPQRFESIRAAEERAVELGARRIPAEVLHRVGAVLLAIDRPRAKEMP